jgi:hypothetical protein
VVLCIKYNLLLLPTFILTEKEKNKHEQTLYTKFCRTNIHCIYIYIYYYICIILFTHIYDNLYINPILLLLTYLLFLHTTYLEPRTVFYGIIHIVGTHVSAHTHVSYPLTRKDISEMGNSMCAHESSQTVRVNRVLSARIKSETPIWQGWVDLNTLRPSPTSWTRLRNKFFVTVYAGKT